MHLFASVYLNHVGRAEPQVRRDDFAVHQYISLTQSSWIFPPCKYIQESAIRIKKQNTSLGGLFMLINYDCVFAGKCLTMFYRFLWHP